MTTAHATTLDIQAILIARRAVLDAAVAAAHAAAVKPTVVYTSKPAAPAPVATPAAAPVSDADLSAFIGRSIPALQGAISALVTPPFHASEVVDLIQLVSTLVRDGLPQAQGQDARAIVISVFTAVVETLVTPRLPLFVRFAVPGLISMAVHGLEAVYQLSVKRRA